MSYGYTARERAALLIARLALESDNGETCSALKYVCYACNRESTITISEDDRREVASILRYVVSELESLWDDMPHQDLARAVDNAAHDLDNAYLDPDDGEWSEP